MIVCLGTTPALARTMEFDGLAIDGVNRAKRVTEYAAGKAVNAARAAATLGATDVACVSPAGGGTGDRFAAAAKQDRVEHWFVQVASPTRLCVTVVDRRNGTSTELIEETGVLTPAEGEQLIVELSKRFRPGSVCLLSGSVAPGLSADFYERSVLAVHEAGGRVIVDASGEPLRRAIAARPEVIKINAGELASVESIAGENDAAVLAAARSLAKRASGWVIVTRGRQSTIAVHADGRSMDVSVVAVDVVSAIGSGDSFAGALAVALSHGDEMPAALMLASAAASANAMTATAARFEAAEVERLRTLVEVRELPSS